MILWSDEGQGRRGRRRGTEQEEEKYVQAEEDEHYDPAEDEGADPREELEEKEEAEDEQEDHSVVWKSSLFAFRVGGVLKNAKVVLFLRRLRCAGFFFQTVQLCPLFLLKNGKVVPLLRNQHLCPMF